MLELSKNQAALILETDDEGVITVNVSSPDPDGLAGALCHVIALKLTNDEELQTELMAMLEEE